MMVVDSSVWVALFSENDSQHGKAVKVSALLSNVVLTEYVILETSSFLLRAVGKAEAKKFLEFALNNSEVAVLYSSPEFFADVSHLFRSLENRRLSFVDVSLLYLSHTHHVITLDKALQKEIRKSR